MKRHTSFINLALVFLLWFSLAFKCGSSNDGSSGSRSGSRVTASREYAGKMTITITYLDPEGNFQRKNSFQHNDVKVFVGPPRRAGSMVDSNPISLTFGSNTSQSAEGQLSVGSAEAYTDVRDKVSVVLQYWKLELDGNELSGTLTDNHTAEGAALPNHLNAIKEIVPGRPNLGSLVFAHSLAKGTRLEGMIDDDAIRLNIEGNVSEQSKPFAAEVVARRVK